MIVIILQRAFGYLQQAADAGNSNAMAYLGKVRNTSKLNTGCIASIVHENEQDVLCPLAVESLFKEMFWSENLFFSEVFIHR